MLIIFFLFGLIIGSFLNVVVYRLNLAETVLGRSHCPDCRKKIRWYDNVPVLSFLLLGTKCRDCGEKISWQYPLLELATGIVFAVTANVFFVASDPGSWLETAFYLGLFSLLLVIFIYDLKFMEIPMLVLWIAVGWTLAYFLFQDFSNFSSAVSLSSLKMYSGLIGGGAAFLFFFSLAYFSKETWMGMGDAYLAFLIGLVAGWPMILPTLILSFSIGALVGIVLIFAKKKTMKSQIPFGPFLIAGLALSIFCGDYLIKFISF